MAEAENMPPPTDPQNIPVPPLPSTEPDQPIPEADQHKYQLPTLDGPEANSGAPMTWTASEFISHEKSSRWYGGLILAAILAAGLIYLFTKDIISASFVLIAALFFGIMAARKPRELQYSLHGNSLKIGQKNYTLDQFRSFAVIDEGAIPSIVFMPLKRFSPLITIYYAPDDEHKIIDILADRLPFEERDQDPLDRFMHRIRF
jgi:hypothetical protein